MGKYNSSVTRVWPVIDYLFKHDPTGVSWLNPLLRLGSRAELADQTLDADPGILLPQLALFELNLPGPLREALDPRQAARIGRIRNAYEAEIPPALAFLRWLLEHPERLVWPRKGPRDDRMYGPATNDKRRRLLAGDTAVREEALKELATLGATGSRMKWWAFEGFTSVDCRLETESLLVLIEGKRTEPVSHSTDWFPGRNQVIRNLEVAQALAGGQKGFAVLLCAEATFELADEVWTNSLPHLSPSEIENLKSHYLGCATWAAIAQELCPGLQLPENVEEAITTCLGFRQ